MDAKNPQIEVSVTIDAPLKRVWEYAMDISHIPEFHPRVDEVEFLSGTTQRAEGVEYRCNILTGPSRGRGTCVEKIGEVVPMEHFEKIDDERTRMTIRQYYSPNGLKGSWPT